MLNSPNSLFRFHSYSGALSVALGAFGAHGLKQRITDVKMLEVWETACRYHMIHSLLGLFVSGLGFQILNSRSNPNGTTGSTTVAKSAGKTLSNLNNLTTVSLLLGIGNILFSGSLYGIVLTGIKKLGVITPIGGLIYIIAWCKLGWNGLDNFMLDDFIKFKSN